jgi:hypothetical protein
MLQRVQVVASIVIENSQIQCCCFDSCWRYDRTMQDDATEVKRLIGAECGRGWGQVWAYPLIQERFLRYESFVRRFTKRCRVILSHLYIARVAWCLQHYRSKCDLLDRQKTAQGRPVSSPNRGVDAGADWEDEYKRIEIVITSVTIN